MKKILLTLGLLFLTSVSALAFTMPRWSFFPVKVYVPEDERAVLINEALDEWSAKSGGVVKFKISKSKISANIVFDIVDSANQIGSTDIHAATTYLFKVDVKLAKTVNGGAVSERVFKSAALHEVANAIALKPTEEKVNITYKDFYGEKLYPVEITDNDVAALELTYKETSIRENITKKRDSKKAE